MTEGMGRYVRLPDRHQSRRSFVPVVPTCQDTWWTGIRCAICQFTGIYLVDSSLDRGVGRHAEVVVATPHRDVLLAACVLPFTGYYKCIALPFINVLYSHYRILQMYCTPSKGYHNYIVLPLQQTINVLYCTRKLTKAKKFDKSIVQAMRNQESYRDASKNKEL